MNYGLDPKTIIRLLLDFAPESSLEYLQLTEDTSQEWVELMERERNTGSGRRTIVDLSSLALYYTATKSNLLINNREKASAYGKVEVDFYTLYHFAKLVKAENHVEVVKLIKGVEKEIKQRRMAKARTALTPKHDWDAIFNLEVELLRSGACRRDLAGIIERRTGVPKSTYRAERRKREKETTV